MEHIITNLHPRYLHESPFNPRRTYNEAKLQELASDIKAQGVLSPLLVRPLTKDGDLDTGPFYDAHTYQLIFGHRRLRAAVLAGIEMVPCMVRAMTDAEVKRAQISENLQREDVHPIEEAEGFAALMNDHGVTAEQLVEETGKSRSYIYGRLALLKACAKVRDACLANKIGSETALLIARLRTEKLQQKALDYINGKFIDMEDGGQKSYRQVRELLREKFTLQLKGAIFDTADPFLLPDAGDCTSCAKRTGNAPEFHDLTLESKSRYSNNIQGDEYLCTDPDCFDAKKKAHLRNQATELEQQGKTVVDGAKARAAIDADGKVKGAYIALKDVKAELKRATGPKPETVLIQDPRTGKTVEAVNVSALQAAGVAVSKEKQQKGYSYAESQRKHEESRKKKEARAEIETKFRLHLLAVVRERAAAQERSVFDLLLIAKNMVNLLDHHERKTVAKLWGFDQFMELQAAVASMDTTDLTRLMMDCALAVDTVANAYADGTDPPEALLEAAAHYGIDPEALRAEVQTPEQTTSTPSPAARATKGSGPKAKKAKPETAAEAPAARARKAAKPGAGAKQGKGKSKTIQKVEASSAGNDQMDDVGIADEERDPNTEDMFEGADA
jgi:ParB/RepB/Spo0J family partition protein